MLFEIALFLIWLTGSIWRALRLLQILQIEEYEVSRYLRWLLRPRLRLFEAKNLLATAALLIFSLYLAQLLPEAVSVVIVLMLAAVAVFQLPRREVKLPLVPTARMLTLIGATSVLTAALLSVAVLILRSTTNEALLWMMLVYQMVPLVIIVANTLLKPVELFLKRRQVEQAKAIMAAADVKVIGITGSFGKTSTKEFLYHILSSKYRILKTPKSFNTPLGISQVVRGNLGGTTTYDYFIVEMGAYLPGNIKDLCDIVHPDYGLLTAIGPAHLERFGSIDAILDTKMELIESLPAEGVAVFNADYPRLVQRAAKTHVQTTRLISIKQTDVDIYATGITASSEGLQFRVHVPDHESVIFKTRLLGEHNVSNILMSTALALQLSLTLDEIATAVQTIQPVEHRLQLSRRNGINIIDDSYNSNPEGARQALEALSLFQQGQRILVTPGFAELGTAEAAAHHLLGKQAAAICDHVFLISGERTKPIEAGLLEGGTNSAHIHSYKTLTEATDNIWKLVLPGDTILFLNDLPDTYG